MSYSNIRIGATNGDGAAVRIDDIDPSFLQYHVVENDGTTNLAVDQGTVMMWINPSWASTNLGGAGPGEYSRLIEVGSYTTNASYGWWSFFLSPDGSTLNFSAQTNSGLQTNFLSAPVSFALNTWAQIVLTYSATNSALYVNGLLVTNGLGVTIYPGAGVLSNGFFLGSDTNGTSQIHALVDDVATFDIELDSNTIAGIYDVYSIAYYGVPATIANFTNAPSFPTNTPFFNVVTGPGSLQFISTNTSGCVTSSNIWLTNIVCSFTTNRNVNVTFTVSGGSNGVPYDVFGASALSGTNGTNSQWSWLGQAFHCSTYRFTVQSNSAAFFVLGQPQDSDGDGLTDAYEMLVSKTDPFNPDTSGQGLPDGWQIVYFRNIGIDPDADPDGDGWSNLQEFLNGTNPNQFDTPPPPQNVVALMGASITNVVLRWTSGGGPVDHYGIEEVFSNGFENEIGTVDPETLTFTENINSDYTDPYREASFPQPNYYIRANFTNGGHADSHLASIYKSSFQPDLSLIPGPNGQAFLAVASPPPGLTEILLYWVDDLAFVSYQIALIDATNLVNGLVQVPTNQLNGWPLENGLYCTLLGTNGIFGQPAYIQPSIPEEEIGNFITPFKFNFLDTRADLKENLKFLVRSATVTRPFSFTSNLASDGNDALDPDPAFMQNCENWLARPPTSTNYEYYGSRMYIPNYGYSELMPLRPIQDNFLWRNFAYTGTFSGGTDTGAYDDFGDVRTLYQPLYRYTGSAGESPLPMPLSGTNDTWLFWNRPNASASFDYAAAADMGVFPTNGNLFVASGVKNCYGLPLTSIAIHTSTNQIATPGSTVPIGSDLYFPNFASPIETVESYYFASQTRYLSKGDVPRPPLPGTPDFTVTNVSPLLVTSVGQPITVAGWAKESILNNYPIIKYAYLEQFFDTAYKMDTNGARTTNKTGLLSPYGEFLPTEPGPTALVTMPDIDNTSQRGTAVVQVISLNVDGNHDGVMDFTFGGPDFVTPSKPFRFWINDDNDSGETGGDDISITPGFFKATPNGLDNTVNGVRDLVDFFPVYLNIQGLLQAYPPDSLSLWLKQADSALNYIDPSWYADIGIPPNNCISYLTDTNVSYDIARVGMSSAPTYQITDIGEILSTDFVAGLRDQGKGMLLIEARTNTTAPLVLEIRQGTNVIAQTQLPLSISPVEQMFRQKNLIRMVDTNSRNGFPDRLADSDVPNEPYTNDKNLIFLHGYNVNPNQARGWFGAMFKRLYWSGSHAKFYGVTYNGSDTQNLALGFFTPDLQTNIVHAFESAPYLSAFLNGLSGTNILAAHSLGNMVTLAAMNYTNTSISKFFMIDAAVALEALDGSSSQNTNMIHPDWNIPTNSYATRLWASEWYTLFPTNDYRSTLTWRNRLANLGNTEVYNFFSSGEEVLREFVGRPPDDVLGTAAVEVYYLAHSQPVGVYTWAMQEKSKGVASVNRVLGSSHGGWSFNTNAYGYTGPGGVHIPLISSDASLLTDAQLRTNAFFDFVGHGFFPTPDGSLLGSNGSSYAQINRDRILSDAIPALTLPVGANPVARLTPQGGADRNFDMQNSFKNGWPIERTADSKKWHHSDIHEVAYTFIYKAFDKIVAEGNLK